MSQLKRRRSDNLEAPERDGQFSTVRKAGHAWRRVAVVVGLFVNVASMLPGAVCRADEASQTSAVVAGEAQAGAPERPLVGYLILGPYRHRDTGRQVGWVFTVGFITAPITSLWYFGTLVTRGPEAAQALLEPPVEGDPGQIGSARIPPLDYGDYHALVIGIDRYDDFRPLKTAVSDAAAVSALLRDHYGFKVNELVDADRGAIIGSFVELRKRLRRNDNLLIYYAGHGHIDRETEEAYWIPRNGGLDDPTHWISNSTITTALKAIPAKHILVVADSCFSGSIVRDGWAVQGSVASLVRRKARLAMTSGGLEPVTDSGGGQHSVFAGYFIRALEENVGILEGSELFGIVRSHVTSNARQVPEYAPIHLLGHDGGDFIFVRRPRP